MVKNTILVQSKKNVSIKAFFTLTVFDTLLFEGRSVLSPAQRGKGSEGVKVSVKNHKSYWDFFKKLLEK